MPIDRSTPFVLLDDAQTGHATLHRDPVRVIEAREASEVRPALDAVRVASAEGLHAAGFLSYEAGQGIEPRLVAPTGYRTPLVWFGLFAKAEPVDVEAFLPDASSVWSSAPQLEIDRETYGARLDRVLELIAAGDIYQANLTFPARVRFAGDPLALYARLRRQARAHYGAVVSTGPDLILSLSPELFFALDGDRLHARPMKGTAARGATPAEDVATIASLRDDPKQRAENLMIVDLLRNDLSRVAAAGSVAVPALYEVETYPTIHQMVSDITATLAPSKDAIDALAALFPCGSITGAPKIRASEVIAEVEEAPRGIYTGAIGQIEPGGDAMFNVAIRTLLIWGGEDHATIGLGSGIVADSRADEEWAECLAKGAFVTAGQRRFDLIETMAFDPENGIVLLERHLARMKDSADLFGFPFDRHATRNELQAATFRLRGAKRIRLVLAPSGALAIEVAPMPAAPEGPVSVAIAPLPVAAADFRLRHKTSDRRCWETARVPGAFETVFTDADGFLTEGSISSIFVERDGRLVTPPLARGLLPGVLRAELIESGRAVEGDLTPANLAGGFFIGNALRGLVSAVTFASAPNPRV
jgi:para-aminobenzoate synthetase/4-amino-4-deoxychorismate lyase